MQKITAIAFILHLAFYGQAAFAEDAPVRLSQSKPLAKQVAAFPRVVNGGVAGDKINAALNRNEKNVRQDMADCYNDARGNADYQVNISLTMKGPEFISFDQNTAYDCGGPHPDDSDLSLVFDLKTGSMVNWYKVLPPSMVKQTKKSIYPEKGTISSDMLSNLYFTYHGNEDAECDAELKTAMDDFQSFQLYPDAARNGIALSPVGLVHIIRATCGHDVIIPLDKLRNLGVQKRLLDAIQVAHDHGWYDPSQSRD